MVVMEIDEYKIIGVDVTTLQQNTPSLPSSDSPTASFAQYCHAEST